MTKSHSPTKDRYVVEDGIPTIRPLHPLTRKPMPTDREKDEAIKTYEKAMDVYRMCRLEHNRSKP